MCSEWFHVELLPGLHERVVQVGRSNNCYFIYHYQTMMSIIVAILTISSISAYGVLRTSPVKRFGAIQSSLKMVSSTENARETITLSSQSQSDKNQQLRNLKSVPVKEDGALLARWNELKGLSEKELIVPSASSIMKAERSEIALGLAYRRCEYVTQLFSKTFYMGTSLMRPDARAHVWAIYAWCRRTDDIVDSPRALLNREVLNKDLEDWSLRLDKIWAGNFYIVTIVLN